MTDTGTGRPWTPNMGSARFAFWIALLTAFTTGVSFRLAILTPPKAGPLCVEDCVGYPYTDVAASIPRDFLWMYPALLPAPLFVMLVSGLARARGRRSQAIQPSGDRVQSDRGDPADR